MIKLSPKDFFLHIGSIATLYWATASLIGLIFAVINRAVPDAADAVYQSTYTGGIRFAIASLIIIFPAFLIISRLIRKSNETDPEKRESWLRKILIYLTLFIAGGIILGDLVAVLNSFLGGELTMRFFLKALTLLLILGFVFSYYTYELRKDSPKKTAKTRGYETVAIVVVVAAIVLGFYYLGSPFTQRNLQFDQERVRDLEQIQFQIVEYWQSKGELPRSLDNLNDSIKGFGIPTDPDTGDAYEYRALEPTTFELCATFAHESDSRAEMSRARFPSGIETSWQHDEGRTCFIRTIDPDFFPVRA